MKYWYFATLEYLQIQLPHMSMVLQSNMNNIAHKLAHLSFAITTQSINIQLISSVSDFSVMIIASRRTSGRNGTATVVCLFVSVTRGRTYKDYPVKIEISIIFHFKILKIFPTLFCIILKIWLFVDEVCKNEY